MRAAARVLGAARDSANPDAIYRREAVPIGGIRQWISVRGADRGNPILLFLHGGPGFTMWPVSYLYQASWEEYFTVVQWDQRGAGKTYRENDARAVAPTMSVARMIADAEELVAYLRRTYQRDKIFVMGHSWGTVLGLELARRHPDWLFAYIGIGQVVDMAASERRGYEQIVAQAERDGNRAAQAELGALAPYPESAASVDKLEIERKWLVAFGGYNYRNHAEHYGDVMQLSPDYDERDRRAFGDGITFSLTALWPELRRLSFRAVNEVKCPIVFFHGRYDLTTSASLLAEWYATVQAPVKRLIWFERSAHMVPEEEPGKVLVRLVADVLPLARPRE